MELFSTGVYKKSNEHSHKTDMVRFKYISMSVSVISTSYAVRLTPLSHLCPYADT